MLAKKNAVFWTIYDFWILEFERFFDGFWFLEFILLIFVRICLIFRVFGSMEVLEIQYGGWHRGVNNSGFFWQGLVTHNQFKRGGNIEENSCFFKFLENSRNFGKIGKIPIKIKPCPPKINCKKLSHPPKSIQHPKNCPS